MAEDAPDPEMEGGLDPGTGEIIADVQGPGLGIAAGGPDLEAGTGRGTGETGREETDNEEKPRERIGIEGDGSKTGKRRRGVPERERSEIGGGKRNGVTETKESVQRPGKGQGSKRNGPGGPRLQARNRNTEKAVDQSPRRIVEVAATGGAKKADPHRRHPRLR